MGDISCPGVLDKFLLTAIKIPKDRIFLLKLDKELESFINDQSKEKLSFPPMNSYQRRVVHRIADYFRLDHVLDVDRKSVILYKNEMSSVPMLRISDLLESSPEASPQINLKIMQRSTSSDANSNSNNPDGTKTGETKLLRRFEEREAKYLEARARIFNASHNSSTSSLDSRSEVSGEKKVMDNGKALGGDGLGDRVKEGNITNQINLSQNDGNSINQIKLTQKEGNGTNQPQKEPIIKSESTNPNLIPNPNPTTPTTTSYPSPYDPYYPQYSNYYPYQYNPHPSPLYYSYDQPLTNIPPQSNPTYNNQVLDYPANPITLPPNLQNNYGYYGQTYRYPPPSNGNVNYGYDYSSSSEPFPYSHQNNKYTTLSYPEIIPQPYPSNYSSPSYHYQRPPPTPEYDRRYPTKPRALFDPEKPTLPNPITSSPKPNLRSKPIRTNSNSSAGSTKSSSEDRIAEQFKQMTITNPRANYQQIKPKRNDGLLYDYSGETYDGVKPTDTPLLPSHILELININIDLELITIPNASIKKLGGKVLVIFKNSQLAAKFMKDQLTSNKFKVRQWFPEVDDVNGV